MGTCLICGTSVDGHVCASHEQDVVFEFRGNHSNQLTPDRFYRGEVDGVAEFGVFVNLSDRVTGLLHQSELPRRLESFDWSAGDELFVLVKEIRDNGDVDLGWSIRQSDREFRGRLIQTPSGDEFPEEPAETAAEAEPDEEPGREPEPEPGTHTDSESPAEPESESEPEAEPEVEAEEPAETRSEPESESVAEEDRTPRGERAEPDRVGLGTLEDHIGDRIQVEGRVAAIRQTGGPTVFRVRDETGAADCAAFEAPGVRAYADVEEGDVVRIQGIVEPHNDSLQVETDALSVLSADEAGAVDDRMESALEDRARPETVDTLADFPPVSALESAIGEAATVVRRAVFDARPVVIRHAATADGYLAGAAIERAVLSLVRDEHEQRDAVYHYVDRRPFEGPDYDMNDATRDVTDMLDRRERHGEKLPLFLFVGAGGTEASSDGLGLLEIYEADRVIVDAEPADDAARRAVSAAVTPTEAPAERVTTTTIAAALGATVDDSVAGDLHHLPATSYWRETPSVYADLAAAAGYDPADLTLVRKAVALEAFYQAFEDKRELITDLLFGDPALAEPASEQFDDRLATEVDTAEAHLEERTVGDRTVAVLDVAAFTHRYDFPPTALLLDHLFERVDADALIGVGEDDLRIRADPPVDVRAVADRVREVVEEAGIGAEGGRSGRITFLVGERDVVLDAAIGAVANLAVA